MLRAAAASAREADVPAVDALLRGGFLAEDEFYRALAAELGLPFVYLGYWVPGSAKMAYKAGLRPLEILRLTGWSPMTGLGDAWVPSRG